jgi:hypothetical protein
MLLYALLIVPLYGVMGIYTKQAALDFSAICLPLTQLIPHSNPLSRIVS